MMILNDTKWKALGTCVQILNDIGETLWFF